MREGVWRHRPVHPALPWRLPAHSSILKALRSPAAKEQCTCASPRVSQTNWNPKYLFHVTSVNLPQNQGFTEHTLENTALKYERQNLIPELGSPRALYFTL